MINLTGKVAVVTGGARGLGKSMCLRLAQAGAKIVLGDLIDEEGNQVVKEIEAMNGEARYAHANVTSEEEMNNLVQLAVDQFGGLDIMVNNAGISLTKPFMSTELADLKKLMDINIGGTYNGCKAAIPQLVARKGGRIINIASMAGKEGWALLSLYSTTKFGVIGMTQALSKELGELNITVNAVCPGLIKTKMHTEEILIHAEEVMGIPGDAIWDAQIANVPLKRPQTPESIADMVVFLASDMASEVTGQAINVNGGQVTH